MKSVSIIIPCYNEEQTIYELLERVSSENTADIKLKREIIVVDDGSTDNSKTKIEEFIKAHKNENITLISYKPNRGKGTAIKEALKVAKGDIILIQDADLEYDPHDYPKLLAPILSGAAQVVYGSRWIAPKMKISGPLYALGGWLENRFLHLLYRTNISDIATGYKVFKSDLLKSLDLQCKGFEFCPEATAKLLNRNIPIIEVPINYQPRTKKEGKKIKWTDFIVAIYTILKAKLKKL